MWSSSRIDHEAADPTAQAVRTRQEARDPEDLDGKLSESYRDGQPMPIGDPPTDHRENAKLA